MEFLKRKLMIINLLLEKSRRRNNLILELFKLFMTVRKEIDSNRRAVLICGENVDFKSILLDKI